MDPELIKRIEGLSDQRVTNTDDHGRIKSLQWSPRNQEILRWIKENYSTKSQRMSRLDKFFDNQQETEIWFNQQNWVTF